MSVRRFPSLLALTVTLLYVFPHPDDESFCPGPAIARQAREGHAVHLLTLTQGGATTQRHAYGYTVEEMGAIRARETRDAAATLGCTSATVLDFPDGGLANLDPRDLEAAVRAALDRVQPDVLVTYAAHGNSGHLDHLVTHAVVKRVFCERREDGGRPRRLALFTLIDDEIIRPPSHLRGSPREDIGAIVTFTDADRRRGEDALRCYETFQAVVAQHDPLKQVANGVPFALFQEEPDVVLDDLTVELAISAVAA
ncbi:MAG: PIG-L family deacetylase [Bacteroidota bacterium]